jgi:hypothetical protein
MDDFTATAAPADFDGIVRAMVKTRPWVRLMAVLAFISVGFMALAGLFGGIAGVATGEPTVMILLIVYPLCALLYLFPAIYLWRYANRINDFVRDRSTASLEPALDAQRSFWKFAGIVVILSFVLALVIGVLMGVFAAAA